MPIPLRTCSTSSARHHRTQQLTLRCRQRTDCTPAPSTHSAKETPPRASSECVPSVSAEHEKALHRTPHDPTCCGNQAGLWRPGWGLFLASSNDRGQVRSRNSSTARRLGRPGGFEEEPRTPLRLIDPDLEQARGCYVAVLIAEAMRLAQMSRQLQVVLA